MDPIEKVDTATVAHREQVSDPVRLQEDATVRVENFDGFSLPLVASYIAVCFMLFNQLIIVISSGVFSGNIAEALDGSSERTWLSLSATIVSAALCIPISKASDYWGRKWLLVSAGAAAFVGTIVTARAETWGVALGGSILCGYSQGAQPLLYAVAAETVPRQWRSSSLAFMNIGASVAGVYSLLVGSTLIKNSADGWRTFYYINTGLAGASLIVITICYNPPTRELQKLPQLEKLKQLDWMGFFISTVAVVLFSVGLSLAKNPYSWSSPEVLCPLIIGIVFGFILFTHQRWLNPRGMFHHDLFSKDKRNVILASFFAANSYIAFEDSVLYNTDVFKSDLKVCTSYFAAIVVTILYGIFAARFSYLRETLIVAFIFYVAFNVCMSTLTTGSGNALWAYCAILGIGIPLSIAPLFTVGQLAAPIPTIALLSGVMLTLRSLGGSIGMAACTAIFSSQTTKYLVPDTSKAALEAGLSPDSLQEFIQAIMSGNAEAAAEVPSASMEIIMAATDALKEAYVKSFRYLWVFSACASVLGLLGVYFIRNPVEELTKHVDAPIRETSTKAVDLESK
ncbi:major facilitator superfamily domain-containing protein [Dactylonectria macrodidyma]|uniref:Major facilitator superfamily domain-containing protein n=1 Tax=Dactylonectria macrodidyma TaxID=307937 RepID=A0A9P9IJ61_9HYPO|nr:major facilitator superfamily domain-containing protein [Dactylonectria macrodidyma]